MTAPPPHPAKKRPTREVAVPERFTEDEVRRHLRDQVAAAGGARKWLRKHKLSGFDHVLHMIEDGRLGTDERLLSVLGFKRVVLYEAVPPAAAS